MFPLLCFFKDFIYLLGIISDKSIGVEYPKHRSNLPALTYIPKIETETKIPHLVSLLTLDDLWEDRNQGYQISTHFIT